MPLVSLSPEPILRFVGNDSLPLVGGKLFTYQAGTNTPYPTYTDSTAQYQHANPIALNSRGEVAVAAGTSAGLWIPSGVKYKFVLQDALGNQVWSLDNIDDGASALIGSLTSNEVSQILTSLDLTKAEEQAGIAPTDFSYPPGDVRRYGAIASTSLDATAAFQAAFSVAAALSGTGAEVFIPQGSFRITQTLEMDITTCVRGSGKLATTIIASGFTQDQPIIRIVGDQVVPVNAVTLRDFTLSSDNNLALGIDSVWLENSNFVRLYFYQLYRGYNGLVSFSNNCIGCSSYLVTLDDFTLGDDCNNWVFTGSRFVGQNGVLFIGHAHAALFDGCDFEGITSQSGAGVKFRPATGKVVHAPVFKGCYFENIAGFAVSCEGADLNSVKGLVMKGNYITGGFINSFHSIPGNAVNAIKLYNAVGFDISNNYFEDYETSAFLLNGTERNGTVWNNTGASCPALTTGSTWHSSVDEQNNFAGRGVSWVTTSPVGTLTGSQGDIAYNRVPTNNFGWMCTVAGTPGTWLPFGVPYLENSIPYDPANIADGTGFTTTITVTGAVLGDYVMISFSRDLQGIILTAYVSIADTVGVRFQNETGGAIDLASGTIRARVFKQ